MGRPLVNGADLYIAYPITDKLVGFCANIHPNIITGMCILFKIITVKLMYTNYYFSMFITRFIERILDCLDGEVARTYDKRTTFGHLLDKYSDLVFGIITIYSGINMAVSSFKSYFKLAVFLLCCLGMPYVYVHDVICGRFPENLSPTKEMYAIYVEDNSVMLSVIVPLLLFFIRN